VEPRQGTGGEKGRKEEKPERFEPLSSTELLFCLRGPGAVSLSAGTAASTGSRSDASPKGRVSLQAGCVSGRAPVTWRGLFPCGDYMAEDQPLPVQSPTKLV